MANVHRNVHKKIAFSLVSLTGLLCLGLPMLADDEPSIAPQRSLRADQDMNFQPASSSPSASFGSAGASVEHGFESVDPIKELLKKGIRAHGQGNDTEAEQAFRNVLSRDPDNAHALFNLGAIYQSRGNMSEARDNYQEVLRSNPNDALARQALDNLERQSPSANTAAITPFQRPLRGNVGQTALSGNAQQQALQGRAQQNNFEQELLRAQQAQQAQALNTVPYKSGIHLHVPTSLIGSASTVGLKALTGAARVGATAAALNLPGMVSGGMRLFDDDNDSRKLLRGSSGLTSLPLLGKSTSNPLTGALGSVTPHNFGGLSTVSPHNFGGLGGMPHNFGGLGAVSPHNFGGLLGHK